MVSDRKEARVVVLEAGFGPGFGPACSVYCSGFCIKIHEPR